jgi:hypothetical protein
MKWKIPEKEREEEGGNNGTGRPLQWKQSSEFDIFIKKREKDFTRTTV